MSGGEAAAVLLAGVAFLHLAVVSVVLWIIDVREHRLPNRLVLPAYVVGLVMFLVSSTLDADLARLVRAIASMAILFAFYFCMRLASPASIGGGDVKLAGLLGLYLGWVGWSALLFGMVSAFLIGGIHAVILILAGRADRRTRIPFGPAMLGGAWLAIGTTVIVPLVRSAPGV